MLDKEEALGTFQSRIAPDDIYETALFLLLQVDFLLSELYEKDEEDYIKLITQNDELIHSLEMIEENDDILELLNS